MSFPELQTTQNKKPLLYSHNIENEKFGMFVLFLNHVIHGDTKYEEPVNLVIKETRALVKGEKDFYTINRDTFPIVVYLSKQAKTFFDDLPDTHTFDTNVYQRVQSILESQRPLSFY